MFPLLKLTLQWYLESVFCGHKCHPWISKNSTRDGIMTNSEIIWLPRTRYTRGWPLLTPPVTPPPLWIRIWNGCRSKCNGPTIRGLKGHVRTKTLGGRGRPSYIIIAISIIRVFLRNRGVYIFYFFTFSIYWRHACCGKLTYI